MELVTSHQRSILLQVLKVLIGGWKPCIHLCGFRSDKGGRQGQNLLKTGQKDGIKEINKQINNQERHEGKRRSRKERNPETWEGEKEMNDERKKDTNQGR